MRNLASAASIFRKRLKAELPPIKTSRPPQAHSLQGPNDVPVYPVGQSYIWGAPATASHGFAPAIGYDAYLGGNGY